MSRKKGYSEKEYEEVVRKAIFHLMVLPIILLIGILVASQIIESGFGVSGAITTTFQILGGVFLIPAYYIYTLKANYNFDVIKHVSNLVNWVRNR